MTSKSPSKLSSPRLIDIAEAAGLSVSTISRILSNQRASEYNADTRDRVMSIAHDMGWRPNLVVQGMKTGQTQTIGVFMAPFDTHWTGVLYGVHDTLLDSKQVPLVLWPHALVHPTLNPEALEAWASGDEDAQDQTTRDDQNAARKPGRKELERIHCLEDRRVDAIICWPLQEDNARERLTMLSERGWRIVMLDDDLPEPASPLRVASDEADAMRQVVEHLKGLGHQRIAYVGLTRSEAWIKHRHTMFKNAMAVPNLLSLDVSGPSYRQYEMIVPFLEAHPDVTAVIGASDHVARQTIQAARLIGRQIPSDLSVVGFGNDVFGQGDLPLTTIDQHPRELGQLAASLALDYERAEQREYLVSTHLIVRGSTAVAKP